MEPTPTQPTPSPTSILWRYRDVFLRYKTPFFLGIMALLATNAAGTAIPALIQRTIDLLKNYNNPASPLFITPEALLAQLNQIILWLVVLAFVVFGTRVLSRFWITGAGQRIEYDLRNRLYQHLLKMPSQFYGANPTGELMSRMTNDVEALRMMIGGGIMMGFNTLFAYCTTLPMMLKISPRLTLLAFILYPLAVFVLTKLSTRVKHLYYKVQDVLGQISATVQENFTGIAVIQAYGKEATETQRVADESQRYFGTYQNLIKERVLMMMIFVVLGGFSYLAVLSFGGWQVIDSKITLGGFIAFTLYLERITWPTAAMGWTISTLQQGSAALERVDDILSQQPTIVSPEYPVALPQPVRGLIEIRQLSFAYHNPYQQQSEPSDEQAVHWVLKQINLQIQPGETLAIVGPIGSGKSTLLKLLPRLYDVPAQTIFMDGVDITTLTLADLRSAMVLMPQQSFLFSTSVEKNMAFQNPNAVRELVPQLIPMAEAAQVHEEVLGLPHRYQTLVGERGVMLSGGQRQRVSLTRTLLQSEMAQAPVLILDDPFSHVDAGTEERIIAALEARRLLENKTTLFATHRMSMVKKADRVIVMDAGEIVASGTHAQLFATHPLYQALYQSAEITPDEDLG